jgi:hypothetical protein
MLGFGTTTTPKAWRLSIRWNIKKAGSYPLSCPSRLPDGARGPGLPSIAIAFIAAAATVAGSKVKNRQHPAFSRVLERTGEYVGAQDGAAPLGLEAYVKFTPRAAELLA